MKNNIRLLVIEDNEEIIDLIKLYKPGSMDIFDAKDGKEGLKLFYEEKFDLIILDLMLPILDGYQVLKKIRETSDIPIIILSSKNLDFEIILGLDKGADDYIVKPFNPMEDKKVGSVIRKFYDSYHYLYLLGKRKPVHYIYVVEEPGSDSTMRKRLRGRMKTLLPFSLQESLDTGIKMIDKVDVMSIAEWNNDDIYGKYPFVKLK